MSAYKLDANRLVITKDGKDALIVVGSMMNRSACVAFGNEVLGALNKEANPVMALTEKGIEVVREQKQEEPKVSKKKPKGKKC